MSGSITNSNLSTVDSLTQFVNATQSSWNQTTVPVPQGVLIYASDTTVLKLGDGKTLYADLPVLLTLSQLVNIQSQLVSMQAIVNSLTTTALTITNT